VTDIVDIEQKDGQDGNRQTIEAIEYSMAHNVQVRFTVKTILFFLNMRGTLRNIANSVDAGGVYVGTDWRVSIRVPSTARDDGWFCAASDPKGAPIQEHGLRPSEPTTKVT
jgi:hypothetical protein